MNAIEMKNVEFSYGSFDLSVSTSMESGTFNGLIGPNGAGKSTLLKLIIGFLKPHAGEITISGKKSTSMKNKELSRTIAYVAQEFDSIYDYPVEEIVEMGRIPHKSDFFTSFDSSDRKIVSSALKAVNLSGYEKRPLISLSGGEQRRVLLARAIAQETPIIIVDELSAHLDQGQAVKITSIMKKLAGEGKTIIAAFHNLNLALNYCDNIIALKNGKIMSQGKPDEKINEKILENLYGIGFYPVKHPETNKTVFIY